MNAMRFPLSFAARHMITQLGVWTSHPTAFLIVLLYVLAWLALSPRTFDWQAIATLATWIMTLFIQRAEHRDTQAIHAKLDELLRVQAHARGELATLDKKEPEEIEEHRQIEANLAVAGQSQPRHD
jgi:low affinity Fe/Cu permease